MDPAHFDCVRCGLKSKQWARADLRFAPSLHSRPGLDSMSSHSNIITTTAHTRAFRPRHRGDTRNVRLTSARAALLLLSHVIAIVVGVNEQIGPAPRRACRAPSRQHGRPRHRQRPLESPLLVAVTTTQRPEHQSTKLAAFLPLALTNTYQLLGGGPSKHGK